MSTNTTLNSTNVSNLVPPDINANLSVIQKPISAFGDQLKNQATDKIKKTVLSNADKIKKDIEVVVKKKLELEKNHTINLQILERKLKENLLTQEEYNLNVTIEDTNYQISKELLEKEQEKLQQKLINILKDPYKKNKEKAANLKKEFKNKVKEAKKKNLTSDKQRRQALIRSGVKSITPILILLITNRMIKIVGGLEKLQSLVNRTNNVIRTANTPEKINQARVLRNSAVNELDKSQKEIITISKQIGKIQNIITIFGAIVSALSLIPFPVPPKVPTTIQKAANIVSGLGFALGVVLPLLQNIIFRIEDLKRQLLQINNLIDGKTAVALPANEFGDLLNLIGETDGKFENYKGFRFEIKEEEDPRFVVKEYKRRYAVAIDRYNVEVLKSEYSFTLEPQVLIDQLKLIIDQKNLQG